MIDLSFLTDAEQEAILKVLNRDAELKKAEDERIRNLQNVVDDESEFKYKSGQWFYEAKSIRHRDKVHGADLVRASIRKRKKPATIAELGKDSSKRRWLTSVNQDIFIPSELYGVMEALHEADEDVKVKKEEGNQSSKPVGVTSPETEKENQRNGTVIPGKPRQNPFNSGDLQDITDYGNQTTSPQNGQVNGTAKTKADIMSSVSKYGVKLPYPELTKGSQISQKAKEGSEKQTTPVPKPRTVKTNTEPQNQQSSSLQGEDSFNGTGKPRGILKRRSSSSSSDSENVRLSKSIESNKVVLSGSPILEAGQNNYFDELSTASDNSTDRSKQVRFSEKVHQRPPTPNSEPYSGKEIGEYDILDPDLWGYELNNGYNDHRHSEEPISEQDLNLNLDYDSKILEPIDTLESQGVSVSRQSALLETERNLVEPKEEISFKDDHLISLKTSPDIAIELPSNDSAGKEPLYAIVKKTPKTTSQGEDFNLDDALMEPRFLSQRGKTIPTCQTEQSLEFGKSYAGEGKMTFQSSCPEMQLNANEERYLATSSSFVEASPNVATQHNNGLESVSSWRLSYKHEGQEIRQPSLDLTQVKKTTHILQEAPTSDNAQNPSHVKHSPGQYSSETKYRSMYLRNGLDNSELDGLKNNLPMAENGQGPFTTGQTQSTFLRETKGRKDLPKSANFKVMSLNERIHALPSQQMSNPSQYQSLRHFWNVEEKNPIIEGTAVSPNKLLADFRNRNKPAKAGLQQRNSKEISDEVKLPDTFESLSEEEQTSQKVASWLAHTPAMDELDQMDHRENLPYPGRAIVTHVASPTITEAEKLKTEDIQVVPLEKQTFMDPDLTTIKLSPIFQTSLETKPPSNKTFYDRVLQRSNKQSPEKESIERASAPAKSASEFNIGLGKLKAEYTLVPAERSQREQWKPAVETDEVIERSKAPESCDKQDFISSLKKLETEALNQAPLPVVKAETEEVIEASKAPENHDKLDFIAALNKLEIEASNLSPEEHQDNLEEEEIQQHTVSSINSSLNNGFDNVYESETPSVAQSVQFNILQSYPPNKEHSIEEVGDVEETVEKTIAPSQKEELHNALRKLELEALEHSPVGEDLNIHSPITWQTEDTSDEEYQDLSHQDNQPVADEKPVQKVTIETQESADFHNRLRRLEEEAAMIPEEPEDLLEDEPVIVSPFPNREVFISKKVYSSVESLPPVDYPNENEKSAETYLSKLKKLNDLGSPQLATYSGSYPSGTENVLYKKPEVGSAKDSNSKQGKPALTESPSETSPSKHDKYSYEVMKAQDESISKVLDWFNRSTDIGGDAPLPKGKDFKEKTSLFLKETGAKEEESGHDRIKGSGHMTLKVCSDQETPEIEDKIPRLSLSNMELDHDIPIVEHPAPDSCLEDKPVLPGTPLTYGNSGGGCGKISNQETSSTQKNEHIQEANYLDVLEEDKWSLNTKDGSKETEKDTLIQAATKLPASPKTPESADTPHSKFSFGSNDLDVLKDENGIGAESIALNTKLETRNGFELNLSAGEAGKIPNWDNVEDFKEPQPGLFQSGTEKRDLYLTNVLNIGPSPVHILKDDLIYTKEIHSAQSSPEKSVKSTSSVSDIQKNEGCLRQLTVEKDAFPAGQGLHLETENILQFGKCGGGSGKTSNQAISEVFERPQLRSSLSSSESVDSDHTDVLNVAQSPADIVKHKVAPPEQMHLNLGATELPSSQEILQDFAKPLCQTSEDKTENTDSFSSIKKDESVTPSKNTTSLISSNLEAKILEFNNEAEPGNKMDKIPDAFGTSVSGSPLSIDHVAVINAVPSPASIMEDKLVPTEQIQSNLVAMELSPSQEVPKNLEESISSDNLNVEKNNLFTSANIHKNYAQPTHKSGGRKEIWPVSQLFLGSTENASDSNLECDETLISTPKQIKSNLEARYISESAKSDGLEKISNQEGSPLGNSEILNVKPPQVEIRRSELVPPEQIHSTFVAVEPLASLEIPQQSVSSQISLGSIENTDGDHLHKLVDECFTPSSITENIPESDKIGQLEKRSDREISKVFEGSPLGSAETMVPNYTEILNVKPLVVETGNGKLVLREPIHSTLATESQASLEIPKQAKNSQLSLGSVENTVAEILNIEPLPVEKRKDELIPPEPIDSTLETTESLASLEIPEKSVKSSPQLCLGSIENTAVDHLHKQKDESFTPARITENIPKSDSSSGLKEISVRKTFEVSEESPLESAETMATIHSEILNVKPPLVKISNNESVLPEHSALVVTESQSSIEIPEQAENPSSQLFLGSVEKAFEDWSYKQKDESFPPSSITDSSGSGKILNRDIHNVFERPQYPLTTTDGINYNNAEELNVTSTQIIEDESVPAEQMHSNLKPASPLSFEKCSVDKMSNQFTGDTNDGQPQEVKYLHVLDEKDERYQDEKQEIDQVKEHSIEEKIMLDAGPQNLVKSNLAQKKVGDIKLLWESERLSQPTIKTAPNRNQRSFSPMDVSGLSRNSSIDSDDQTTSGLVAFKKIIVDEDEESLSPPIDQLKSFWEKEAHKETAKPVGASSAAVADLTHKIKRLTLNSVFEKDHNIGTEKNLSGRSVSVSGSISESIKVLPKSATFQSLRSFWNVDSKSKSNYNSLNEQAFLESKRQYSSNPDLSNPIKESFVARIKSKLDSKSLMDIREDAPTTSQIRSGETKFDTKHRAPLLRNFSKEKSGDSSGGSTEAQEPFLASKNNSDPTKIGPNKQRPPVKVSDIVSDLVVNSSAPKSEQSLTLQNINSSKDLNLIENGVNNEETRHHNEYKYGPKPFLVKQPGFDATKSPVEASVPDFSSNGNSEDAARHAGLSQVHEIFEKTTVPSKKETSDLSEKLQKLQNEALEVSFLAQNGNLDLQQPEENFSKVLTISSSKNTFSSTHQPIVIELSSAKMHAGKMDTISSRGDGGYVTVQLKRPTSQDIPEVKAVHFERLTSEQNGNNSDGIKALAMSAGPTEDENIQVEERSKKMYDESRDISSSVGKSFIGYTDTFQPAEREPLNDESVASGFQAEEISKREVTETIEKSDVPQKMYFSKSLEKLQKEAMGDKSLKEHVPSSHLDLTESQPKFWKHISVEGSVSEMPTRVGETSMEQKMEATQYEESASENALSEPFTEMRQSTPVKEKNSSLRRSTLELFLAVPYRREISKSMDFDLGEYNASDAMEERCIDDSNPILRALKRSSAKQLKSVEEVSPTSTNQLNSSNPEEHLTAPTENSFPENAEKFKRMSQSVPTFLQDETDGTDTASESSFHLGRHKKSPSSLTNLSNSSGMASMSSVSGSVMSVYSGDFGNVDVRGAIEFNVDYVEQLKEFLIYIYQCRDLAPADLKRNRSDPYVKAYLLPEKAKMGKRKTAVKKKTLNPVYNEILRYKIPKEALMAQTLNLSVWHHDALGRNSFLGEVTANLATWSNTQRAWYQLEPRTPAAGIGLEHRGEMKLAIKYTPNSGQVTGSKPVLTGEVHIWIKECLQLPMLRENKINSFVKCTVLPDTSRKSRQKTRTVDKTANPIYNHTMVYDGFKDEDLREACVELTVWDHNRLSNHFLGGLRVGLGTGKSYGTAVDWMDSTHEESTMWEKMMSSPNTWIEGLLPLRMLKVAKMAK